MSSSIKVDSSRSAQVGQRSQHDLCEARRSLSRSLDGFDIFPQRIIVCPTRGVTTVAVDLESAGGLNGRPSTETSAPSPTYASYIAYNVTDRIWVERWIFRSIDSIRTSFSSPSQGSSCHVSGPEPCRCHPDCISCVWGLERL